MKPVPQIAVNVFLYGKDINKYLQFAVDMRVFLVPKNIIVSESLQ
jgi:hypothetical protein